MNFWQTFRKAPSSNPATWWRYFRESSSKNKLRYYLALPVFSVSTPVWLGSSYITTEFWVNGLSNDFVLQPKHLTPPAGVNFCLAVRWPNRNGDGLGVIRYKLWENVGERLVYPLYNGEVIDKDCVFEIWSSADFEETSLATPYLISLSALVAVNSYQQCCFDSSRELNVLTQVCGLFAIENDSGNYDLPIVFSQCFDDIQNPLETFYRIDENDNIRSNENDDLRVWR